MLAKLYKFFPVLAFIALAGCASGPTAQDIASADYGSVIQQDEAENQIKSYFNRALKDPESARYGFSKVEKGHVIGNAFQGSPLYVGYVVYAKVNAKNSYGGYTGDKGYLFLFQNGRLAKGQEITPRGNAIDLF